MHATGRALGYSPIHAGHTSTHMADVAGGYWTWRHSTTQRHRESGAPCIEIVRGDTVITSTSTADACGGKLANALNRVYGLDGAPIFDERTGDVIRAH